MKLSGTYRVLRSTDKRVYVTATDARTKRSKSATVRGMTPTQFVRLLRRLENGEVEIVSRKPKQPQQVAA